MPNYLITHHKRSQFFLSCLQSYLFVENFSLFCISIPAEVSLGALASHKDDINNIDNEHDHLFTASNGLGRYSHTHTSTTRSAISKHLNVEELEMLLEAYFVQIDGTLNELSTVCNLIFPLDSSTQSIGTICSYLSDFFCGQGPHSI